jgi:urease accessory protein
MSIQLLKLLHLADSAFPIGASSHSFGLETLIADGTLRAPTLAPFLTDLLWESGQAEAFFLRLAHRLSAPSRAGDPPDQPDWVTLNLTVAASKGARESRSASATLGRRFLQTVAGLEAAVTLQTYYQEASRAAAEIHYCAAFGLVGGYLDVAEEATVLAYLQQSAMGLVSACLRLLPIGQGRASELLWQLKPTLVAVAEASATMLAAPVQSWQQALDELSFFTPLVDLGSMRHPTLRTRLFIS